VWSIAANFAPLPLPDTMPDQYPRPPKEMILPDPMGVQDGRIVHSAADQRHWRKEGKDHGRCRCGRRAFIARDVLRMITEREADLPLDDCIDE
jgi:hypothetical protein